MQASQNRRLSTSRPPGSGVAALALAVCVGWSTFAAPARAQPLETVPAVDPARFAGSWYEVARLPNKMQAQCVADVATTFTRHGVHTFDVETKCRRSDGRAETDVGIARIQDPSTNAKLEIRFLPLALAWWPFAWSDYWVLDLAPDYSYALAGAPSRDTLWILSRKPELDPAVYQRLVAKARALGFDVGKLIRPKTAPG